MERKDIERIGIHKIKEKYQEYLRGNKNIEKATLNTRMTDSFYILNNGNSELFWNVVYSTNFEEEAKNTLFDLLKKNSNTVPEKSVNSYLSHLRAFRDFALTSQIDINNEKSDLEALKDFLLDIECLDSLSNWTNKFNVFNVLKISRAEIRHSNVLAWLLDPNENHGLGDAIIRRFIQFVISSFSDDDEAFEILLKDYNDFIVLREWHNIDILAMSQKEKLILCIENKIGTLEHGNQLKNYKNTIEDHYPDYKTIYIYLTPNREESSDPDNWCPMSYGDVLEIIENAIKNVELLPEVNIFINDYLEAIRRDVMGDEKLARICADIYRKHKQAIDLIIENKPDRAYELAEIFVEWAKEKTNSGEIEVDLNKCTKTYTRFKTKMMSGLLPDTEEANSTWKTKNHYFYEIVNNNGNEFYIQLSLNSENLPQEEKDVCERINSLYPSKQQKANWKYKTCKRSKSHKFNEDEEYDIEKIKKQLDECLHEMKLFENELEHKMQ